MKTEQLPPLAIQLFQSLEKHVQEQKFTAWSVGNSSFLMSCFYPDEVGTTYEKEWELEKPGFHPYFDLSSLSKPLFFNLGARLLVKESFQDWMQSSFSLLPSLKKLQLFDHLGGFPAWCFFGFGTWEFDQHSSNQRIGLRHLPRSDESKPKIIEQLLKRCLQLHRTENINSCVYSDLNYFLISHLVQQEFSSSASQILDLVNQTTHTLFKHAAIHKDFYSHVIPMFPYVSTEHEYPNISHRFGNCHDTNQNVLAEYGVVSGHAGLYGRVQDVLSASTHLNELQQEYCHSNSSRTRFVGGLDTPTSTISTAGISTLEESERQNIFGHLGYSGTSFWSHIGSKVMSAQSTVLLTNRNGVRKRIAQNELSRVVSYTNLLEGSTQYFKVTNSEKTSHITDDDAWELIFSSSQSSKIFWDMHHIRTVPDISDIRRNIHTQLWSR